MASVCVGSLLALEVSASLNAVVSLRRRNRQGDLELKRKIRCGLFGGDGEVLRNRCFARLLFFNRDVMASPILQYRVTQVSQCYHECMTVSNKCSSGKKVKQSRGKWQLPSAHDHAPLDYTDIVVERQQWTLQAAKEKQIWKFVKLQMLHRVLNAWKLFGFPVTRNEEGEKLTDSQKEYADTDGQELKHTYSTFLHRL